MLLPSITSFRELMGNQLRSGPSQRSEAAGLIQTQAKKSLGGSKEHRTTTAHQTALLAVFSLWHVPRGEQHCLPTASVPHTALHPSMTEANDALAGFLHAFAAAVSSSLLIASAKKWPYTSPG